MEALDIARLSHDEFEAVCQDLFQVMWGMRLQIFGAGPDGGVDLSGRDAHGGLVVVQCRHWWRTPPSQLVRKAERYDLPRVAPLRPARYVLATSADLTPTVKERLVGVLSPLGTTAEDIYGLRELASELGKRDDVVHRHPRLWFHSAEALAAIVDKGLFERGRALERDVDRSLQVFVPGRSFGAALETLKEHHVLVVSGAPQSGKTTLGHMVATAYAFKDFHVVSVTAAEDVDRAWRDDRPQLFLWDDFLGDPATDWHPPPSRDVLRVIDRVGDAHDKCLVLTTREYLLARAQRDDERMHHAPMGMWTCVLGDGEYDRFAREDIVRRHIAASTLPRATKDELCAGNVPAVVARHRHFYPGAVATVVRAAARGLIGSDAVREHLVSFLDDPAGLWGHVVESQIDDAAHDLFVVLATWGGVPRRDAVRAAWSALRRRGGRPDDPRAFDRAVALLSGTLVAERRDGRETEPRLAMAAGSVADFAAAYVCGRPAVVESLLASAAHFEQVEGLWDALVAHGVALRDLAGVRAAAAEAVVRTLDAPPLDHWMTPSHRLAAVADLAAGLGDATLLALLRERLADVYVMFEPHCDEEDETALHVVVDSLVRGGFEDEVRSLLLPAVRAVSTDDVETVYCLAAFVEWFPRLPAPIGEEADRLVRNAIDAAFARWDDGLDDDGRWLVERMADARGIAPPA